MIDKLIGYIFRLIAFMLFFAMSFVWFLIAVFLFVFILKVLGLV